MKAKHTIDDLEVRATQALRTLLGQVSAIKLREIRRESKGSVLADVDVLGHRHTLACEVKENAQPDDVRAALRNLNNAQREDAAIPVLIVPYLSPEAQTLCKECQAAFLDLEGNARITMGEVFIVKRALLPHAPVTSAAPRRAAHAHTHVPPAA